jgi:ABC-type transport system substrate-binding protein
VGVFQGSLAFAAPLDFALFSLSHLRSWAPTRQARYEAHIMMRGNWVTGSRHGSALVLVLTLVGAMAVPGVVNAQAGGSASPAVAGSSAPKGAAPIKTLRYAFPIAETGFDPAQISDAYSRIIAANMFEAPLTYDPLARPAKVVPQTAQALPEISDNYTRFVFRLKPGIYFADDAAFKGSKRLNAQGKRELTAEDYVFTLKRHYDPKTKSPSLFQLENARILGLSELRKKSIAAKIAFDYDTEVEGVRALDRYTFEVRLASPAPRFYYTFTDGGVMGAVAREVVERYGDKIMEHGAIPLGCMETLVQGHPGAQPQLPRAVLPRRAGRR